MDEIVHHIDRQADRLRARRHRNTDIARAGTENGDDVLEIGRERIAFCYFDTACINAAEIMIAVGRVPAHARAG